MQCRPPTRASPVEAQALAVVLQPRGLDRGAVRILRGLRQPWQALAPRRPGSRLRASRGEAHGGERVLVQRHLGGIFPRKTANLAEFTARGALQLLCLPREPHTGCLRRSIQ